ncbi:SPOR domain-containing protein [Novosphingobium sp. FKTRR1]|uniref:SPOR domain-containing protein n=1 Tax=Novosphingobium sp. FKTRR1 TaxID=2879118 RepID=UPI001CF05E79|nr:SPOR domain-containing protein [Novosphingobium sp. FKTRR1]
MFALGCALSAHAQSQPSAPSAQDADDQEPASGVGRPIVQPTGSATGATPDASSGNSSGGNSSAGQMLNAALSRLAREPRNPQALADAGDAALALGDTAAASGFYTRANEIAPTNGRIKAQIARAQLRGDDPVGALRWFDDAERAGADQSAMALDRGLAFDLVGDNAAAQRQYQLALTRGRDAEATRRYALSLAIAGDRGMADQVLAPLLQSQERAAWRVRTFILAITGSADDAVAVAFASMPQDLAAGIAPYLRFMQRLTPAQQAAAANLGRFPRAADIGRDDVRVLQYAALHPRPARPATVSLALGPTSSARPIAEDRSKKRRNDRSVAPAPAPATPTARPLVVATAAPVTAIPLPPPPPPPPPVLVQPTAGQRLASARPVPSQVQATAGANPATAAPTTAGTAAGAVTSTFDLARVTPQAGAAVVAQSNPAAASAAASPPATPARPTVLARIDMPPPVRRTTVQPSAVQLSGVQPSGGVPAPVGTATGASQPAATAPLATAPVAATAPVTVAPVTVAPAGAAPTGAPPAPVALASAVPPASGAAALAPEGDFHALFEGFRAPADEEKQTVAPVDLAALDAARKRTSERRVAAAPVAARAAVESPQPAAKAAKTRDAKSAGARGETADLAVLDTGCKDAGGTAAKPSRQRNQRGRKAAVAADEGCRVLARADRRDARPDGPTMVSRTTARDPEGDVKVVRGAAEDEKDRSAKDGRTGKDAAGKDKSAKDAKDSKDKSAKDAKDKSAKDAKSAKDKKEARAALSHPSRIWVQVLTGSVRDKMASEWRGLVRQSRALKGHKPFLTPWRSNFRLLTGPFDSEAEAQDFLADLRKDGVSGFQWTSPAGQVVDALPLK